MDGPDDWLCPDWIDAETDLTAAQLWAGPWTDASAVTAYAAADGFAGALRQRQTAQAAADVCRVLERAHVAVPHALPPLTVRTC